MSNPVDGCRIGRLALMRVTSSGCPKGSGCCPTSIVSDASEDDENGTVVAFNPDSIFDNQVTGEDGSGDPGEESTYQETSAIPSDYEYEAYGCVSCLLLSPCGIWIKLIIVKGPTTISLKINTRTKEMVSASNGQIP